MLKAWAVPMSILVMANTSATWFRLVSKHVPEPYLDEVFHVPQAQRYCKNDWSWDPKITTPPGLYLLSLLLKPFLGSCDTSMLRTLNVGAICIICILSYGILRHLQSSSRRQGYKKGSEGHSGEDDSQILSDAHSALNISLFPPLFFFSGLYYTDVISTLLVLLSYHTFVKSKPSNPTFWHALQTIGVGILALLFRQTNIFWVAVFPAGLAVIASLKDRAPEKVGTKRLGVVDTLLQSWQEGIMYDVPVEEASLQDFVILPISVVIAAMRSPLIVLKVILPYSALLALFGAFVAWNGGVVLGDKSNHVATIHTPQMLYLWPYIGLFSLPLLLSPLLKPVIHFLPNGWLKSYFRANFTGSSEMSAPGFLSTVLCLAFGLVAIHYNTIVHPFTLADNRHYTFYVFRILFRHPSIKYLAVPIYCSLAWLAVQVLGPTSSVEMTRRQKTNSTTASFNGEDRKPCQASFIFIWIVTTALSVVTTSLVEPRYFIIPWVMWRLHVPTISASQSSSLSTGKALYDLRLWLETAWHLAIDATLGYLFLYRGFSWSSEPGVIQRFLW